jgi:serine protease Do
VAQVSKAHILIRHLSGSKANQVEQIPLKDLHEITIGRDSSSTIAFDQRRDDVVSRRHATIRVEGGDNPIFQIRDLGSSNGTFLNGQPLSGEVELSPEDIIELGDGGPKFSFDVQPRPANWASRTRVIDAMDTTVTRAIANVASDPAATRESVAFEEAKELETAATTGVVAAKVSVGKDTILHMLAQQRKSTSRVWMGSLAALIAVFAVAGYAFSRHTLSVASTEVAEQTEAIQKNASEMVESKLGSLGVGAKQVYDKYGNTVVFIDMQWRLFDEMTGKPVYQKVIKIKGTQYPAFVRIDGTLYRWLTIDDGNRQNIPIGEEGKASGFVVGDQGFILTNKHVAAGWQTTYGDLGDQNAVIYTYGLKTYELVNCHCNSEFDNLRYWIPATGAPVFSADNATYLGGANDSKHTFTGRDERIEVRFPGNRVGMQANLVRFSTDADVALIKVDAVEALKAVQLGTREPVQVGDQVMALGYPSISAQTMVHMETNQGGHIVDVDEDIPEPTMTEGIVERLGSHLHREGEATILGTVDDAIQLSISSTPGNSGGPVFNAAGHVIGLFTYISQVQGTVVTYAVPIQHAVDLLQPQQAGPN